MNAADLLRNLVAALPKNEFWTAQLIRAERAAKEFLAKEQQPKRRKA